MNAAKNALGVAWITRQQLSAISGLSVEQIRRGEQELKLDTVKLQLNSRTVLYKRQAALELLRDFIVKLNGATPE